MDMSQHPHVVEPRNSSGDGPDEDPPRRSENKRKRFHPFRVVRNIFRKAKRQGSDEVQSSSKKSRSTSELSRVPNDVPQFPGLAPPYAVGLSVSHDSIFTPEHGNGQDDLEASSLSVQHAGLKGFQDELFTRVRARRDSDDDDDDVGLPHSPCTSPTTADVLAQGLKDKSSKSRSTCSASSLLSMGSSENDEDSLGPRFLHLDRRSADFDSELDATQPVPLNHDAALHKIAVRPKRTHGLPHHRKLQQMAASAIAILPTTPESAEDLAKFPSTSETPPPTPPVQETENIDPPEKVSVEEEIAQESAPLLVTTKVENQAHVFTSFEGLKVSEIPSIEEDPYPEREVHVSKGKSAAAELKLRHEIKEFSKRQNEKREGATAPPQKEDELVEVVDVKESIKSLESTISVGDVQNENITAGEEQVTSSKVSEENTNDLEGEGWCVIELGQNPEPSKEPGTEKLKTNESNEDKVQRTVINVTDIQITGHSNDSHSVVTSNVQETEKLPNIADKLSPEPSVSILYQQNQTVPSANAGSSISTTEAVMKDEVQIRAPTQNESQVHSTETPGKRNSIPIENGQHSEMATESKSSPNIGSERPRVVLRRHTSNRTVSQPLDGQKDFRASADVSPSQNFSDIMKHRRSLVDSELSADSSGSVTNYGRSHSEEATPKSTVTTNRFSVEILPFNQRMKNPSYMSPSKTSEPGEEKSSREEKKEDDGSLQQQEGTQDEVSRNKDPPTKPERMQYPIQFRIRKGRSFSEVKDSATKKEEFGDRSSEPKPLLRPKPQLSQEVVGKTPEFLRIQLRSSKEELDKSDISPAGQQPATPQWEVKIQPKMQRQKSGPSSLPYIPPPHGNETKKVAEEKVTEINGNIVEKIPLENKISEEPKPSADPVPAATADGNKDISAMKEDLKPKDDSSSDRMSQASSVCGSEEGIVQGPGSEPELFRVFARRSIKQRNTDKTGEGKSTRKPEAPETSSEEVPKATESNVTIPPPPPQQQQHKAETKVSETPKKQDVKMNELHRKPAELSRGISKEPAQKKEVTDTKGSSEETTKKSEQPMPKIVTAKKVEVEEEKAPIWRNVTKARVNSDVSRQNQVETSLHRRNSVPAEKENMMAREPTQVTVNIGRPTIPLTRNDSSPKLSNNNKDSSGNTPSWMQLAQQRREQREQKERMLYASTGSSSFVLEPNSRPSRNSKVLDMVNNFQKLQTT